MENKPKHLYLVHSQAESEVDKAWKLLEKYKSLTKFFRKIVGITPVREAPVSAEVESFRAMKTEEEAWLNGNGRYW